MNSNVNLKANSLKKIFVPLKKSHLHGGFFLFLCLALGACQSLPLPQPRQVSSLDQNYRLSRNLKSAPASESVQTYRQVVAKTLYNRCKWFPSDSRYAQIAQKRCGNFQGGLMAFSRFLTEEDAVKQGYPIVNNSNHLESVDFPDECSF